MCLLDEDDLSIDLQLSGVKVDAYLRPTPNGSHKLYLVILPLDSKSLSALKGIDWQTILGPTVPTCTRLVPGLNGTRLSIQPTSMQDAFKTLSKVTAQLRRTLRSHLTEPALS